MKKLMIILSAATVLGLFPTNNINAATEPSATTPTTQVDDLKTDWSDTENPNGPWSYRLASDGSLLPNWWFPWGYPHQGDTLMRTTEAEVVPGYRELGDVLVVAYQSGVIARWTAPARGTIHISGASWDANPGYWEGGNWLDNSYEMHWSLMHNGTLLSEGTHGGTTNRSSPADLSLGSGGMNALLNVQVEAGDHAELAFWSLAGGFFGVNFTIALTPDSIDPVAAIEDLAITVFEMNLQNGIENSLDGKLDAALNAMVDVNVNNGGAACNSLAAFINAVEAQRGNKITSAQADQLIASAQQIRAMLNCGN